MPNVRFDVCGVDRLRVCVSSVPRKLPEKVFPDATPGPAYEAVIDRRRWTISFRAAAPDEEVSRIASFAVQNVLEARATTADAVARLVPGDADFHRELSCDG
jgi:hypothetical protein